MQSRGGCAMTEDRLEQEALGWLAKVGYTPRYGPDIVRARQRAALAVNAELVQLYERIGQEILTRQEAQGWGAKGPGLDMFSFRALLNFAMRVTESERVKAI